MRDLDAVVRLAFQIRVDECDEARRAKRAHSIELEKIPTVRYLLTPTFLETL